MQNDPQLQNNSLNEWLKILGKGMVTIPKAWRDELNLQAGDVVRATKKGNKVIIETTAATNPVPYRVFSDKEIDSFLAEDTIPTELAKKITSLAKTRT
ncbi:MAG: AbrB/MazE/SpoVT family DNA-binding domain-containing protein [Patescibacteria group bacterium]